MTWCKTLDFYHDGVWLCQLRKIQCCCTMLTRKAIKFGTTHSHITIKVCLKIEKYSKIISIAHHLYHSKRFFFYLYMYMNMQLAQLWWTGHVIRMPHDRLPKKVFYGELRETGGKALSRWPEETLQPL